MNAIPPPLPDPLDLSWVLEVRRGPNVAHLHPDQVDRLLAYAQDDERTPSGHVRIATATRTGSIPTGSIRLDESDLIECRNVIARRPL